jgi:FxLD family lantipeptide
MDTDLLHPADRNDEEDFELDVRFADNGPVLTELMNATSDNCGSTGASACVTCAASS